MGLVYETRRRAREALAPLLCFALVVYFAYHVIQGDRGLLAWLKLNNEIASASAYNETLISERRVLENVTQRLRPESLDADLLEERARIVLGFVRADEIVILSQPK